MFDYSSIKCDCWRRFNASSAVSSTPQFLCLVWTDERAGVVTLLGYPMFCTVLASYRMSIFVFLYEPLICQCENRAGPTLVQLCQAFGEDTEEDRRER